MLLLCGELLGFFLFPLPAAATDERYLAELTERARRERLAERPEWRALLHYRPRLLGKGVESQVKDGPFFAAPDGRHDPQAELEATLAAFFDGNANDPDKSGQCRYPARYQWLEEVLHFVPGRLPPLFCGRFQKWFEKAGADRLTLIFPASYLNNPASMFGHTLLRIDSRDLDDQTRLLANTINYAAETDRKPGVQYAFRGLFGMYRGRFGIAPYYLEVKEYGDIENRDIWEYALNLTPAETGRLLRHLWELRPAYFDYYFIDENCSYQLLSLLEAARPGLRLTDQFTWWAIPSETVRAVIEAGLVTEVRFRPARTTILRERARLLDSRLQTLALRLATGGPDKAGDELRSLDPKEQAGVIELALDYAAYRQSPRFGGNGKVNTSGLLKARSLLAVPGQTPSIPQPEIPPGEGHRPARAAIGYGFEDRRQFLELGISPGYHDIFDPEGGFTRGAQVKLLDAAFRFYPRDRSIELERIDILDIMSLSSWGRFLHPVSWKADVGIDRKRVDAWSRPLQGRLNGGIGISHDFSEQTTAFAFAEGTLELSDRFAYFVAPGVGPGIGLVHDLTKWWRAGLFFQERSFFLSEWRNDYEATVRSRVTVSRQNIMGFDMSWKREYRNSFAEGKLFWQIFF